MSASSPRVLGLLVVSACLAAGCSSAKKIEVGGTCILNSDCNSPLVCTAGKCHDACHTSADCPAGQSCITASDQSTVCQLPVETHCIYDSDCPTGLKCATDQRCRNQCQDDVDCFPGQICTTTQTCAEPNQVDSNNNLFPPDGGVSSSGGASGIVDAAICPAGTETCACYPNDTCNAGLTCASHLCVSMGAGGSGGGSSDAGVRDAPGAQPDVSIGGTGGGGGGSSGVGGTTSTGGTTSSVGYGISGQSCTGMTGTECNGESCCTSLPVPAGTFPMGRGTETCSNCTVGCPGGMTCGADETPEHNVGVSAFSLDKYEVTVGRFRRFVDAYDAMNGPPPVNGGAHPNISGTGWQAAWNGNLPADAATLQQSLACNSSHQTWARGIDDLPITCVNWYVAFAFCIWDGGRLPTEAEWEYAAAGGSENRLYPWGSSPAPSCALANYAGCVGDAAVVGSYSSGRGRWGHLDLAGNLWEWVFDWGSDSWYSSASASATDVANLSPSSLSMRVLRGGSWFNLVDYLRVANREWNVPTFHTDYVYYGWRCAKTP